MLAKWAPEPGEIGETGGDDYGISVPVKSGKNFPLTSERNGHEKAKWGAVAV